MKTTFHSFRTPMVIVTTFAILAGLAGTVSAAAKIHSPLAYWAFNCFTTCGDANFQPEAVSSASASMTSSFEPDNGSNLSGTTLNAFGSYEARAALTLRTGTGGINNGRSLTWLVNTSGASSIEVLFAVQRSAGGFSSNQFQYTLDGVTFVDFGASFDPSTANFALVSFDLRRIRGLNNNPNAGFRIVFNGGSSADSTQYELIDNLQVTGK